MSVNKYSNTVKRTCWNLGTLEQQPSSLQPSMFAFVRDMMFVSSDTLIIDFDPLLDCMLSSKAFRPQQWPRVALGAQGAIMVTVRALLDSYKEAGLELENPESEPGFRASTKITFNSTATLGFFHTLIYCRMPTVQGQPVWYTTMIMDIRSLDSPKARKTGTWHFGAVGTVKEEYLASAYHDNTKLLAYSMSVEYMDRTGDTHRWFSARLCLAYVGLQEWDIDRDERGTYIHSKTYDLGELYQDSGN
jgi:hypothetical protein